MTQKTQKIISSVLVAAAVGGGFESLIYILNLNQPVIFFRSALWVFICLLLLIVFLFDLHFKRPGSWQRAKNKHTRNDFAALRGLKILTSAFWDRFEHLRTWNYASRWLHFLLLPGFIFWATVSLIYVNFGYLRIQQTLALMSGAALILNFWYLKEAFYRKQEVVDRDIFIVLTVVKIYAAGALYAASLSMLRYYCLSPDYFAAEVFAYTFLLVYQALYQHRLVSPKTIFSALAIALLMSAIGYFVYIFWGYNYFTAAIFMTVCYNLFWGIFHYRLDRALSLKAFLEIFLVSIFIAGMVVSVTNFKARILDGCGYIKSTGIFNITF